MHVSASTSRIYSTVLVSHLSVKLKKWKMCNKQRRATNMIIVIGNNGYSQRLKDLPLINIVQRRLQVQLVEVFKYRTNSPQPVQEGTRL